MASKESEVVAHGGFGIDEVIGCDIFSCFVLDFLTGTIPKTQGKLGQNYVHVQT
jgi:hypothetical protein